MTDINGNTLSEGMYVITSGKYGLSDRLRYGKVVGFTNTTVKIKHVIRHCDRSGSITYSVMSGNVQWTKYKVLIVDKESIPTDILIKLEEVN